MPCDKTALTAQTIKGKVMGKSTGPDPSAAIPLQPGYPNDPDVPDMYAEGVGVLAGYNSFSLVFNRIAGDPASATPIAVVRVSPQQAKLMTMVLEKAIRDYEEAFGELRIPEQLVKQLGIEKEVGE